MSDNRTTGDPGGETGQGGLGATTGQIRQEAAGAVADIKAEAAGVAETAKDQALGFAEQQKRVGAEQAEGLARAVHSAADQLQDSSPEIARYVHDAATAVDRFASSLRDSSPGQLMGQLEDMARRQPVAFFGAAVLAGFTLARFAKSSAEEARTGGLPAGRAQPGRAADSAIGGGRAVPHSTAAGAPGWVQGRPDDAPRPATVAAASLGGAAARTQAQAGQTSPVKDAG